MPTIASWLRFGLEEIKFLKSFTDLKIFYEQKLPFLMPRLTSCVMRQTKVPPSLQLEPTNHCNLDCICCSRKTMKREKGYMDFSLFQKIIDEAAVIGVRRVHLYLHGEPMLHPRAVDMITYIKASGLGITMPTNGMLFTEDKILKLLGSGLNSSDYIIFSILGHSKEVHEKIMRGVNSEKVRTNLRIFLQLRRQHKVNGPIIEAVFYRMPENAHEATEFEKYWRGIVDHVHPVAEISRQFADYSLDNASIPRRNKTCKNLWERMTIFWNGDVTTCIADLDAKYIAGNLKKDTIRTLWNSEILLNFRQLHKDGAFRQLDLCASCDW